MRDMGRTVEDKIETYREITTAYDRMLTYVGNGKWAHDILESEKPVSKKGRIVRKLYRISHVFAEELHLVKLIRKTPLYRRLYRKGVIERLRIRPTVHPTLHVPAETPSDALREAAQPYADLSVLEVNSCDLMGSRFNGFDLMHTMNALGIDGKQYVIEKHSDDPHVIIPSNWVSDEHVMQQANLFEQFNSIHAMVQPFGRRLRRDPAYAQADVVHYHIIHNGVLSLCDLPTLTAGKPSVLTLHDPWLLTGHCVHPRDCERWKTGCRECPYPERVFSMMEDKAALMWQIRRRLLSQSQLELVVSSQWMLDKVKQSPLTRDLTVHLIPFGLNTTLFAPRGDGAELRKKYGVPQDRFVLFFRQTPSEFKGMDFLCRMLERLEPKSAFALLSVEDKGLMKDISPEYCHIEMGRVEDSRKMAELYALCDAFLMPSRAESFGMMAVEAMACGKPVVVADQTALPAVTFAPECGVVVRQDDVEGFASAVQALRDSPEDCARRGGLGRQLVEQHYDYDQYVLRHMALYRELKDNRLKSWRDIKMPNEKRPLVSIIIPVYNGSNYLREAIDSALAQTYDNIEVLVVNDGSDDGGETERIALSYGERIRYFHQENGGVGSALNLGIDNMRGEYFSWLSHDDLYTKDKVAAQVEAVLEEPDPTTIIFSGYESIDGITGKSLGVIEVSQAYTARQLSQPLFCLFRGLVHGCTLLIHRSHFERVGHFDPSLPTTQDYDLWFRIFRDQHIRFLPGVYVRSRVHPGQGSRIGDHLAESDRLWSKYMDWVTDEERVAMSGSVQRFYSDLYVFLCDVSPYIGAECHALRRLAELIVAGGTPGGLIARSETEEAAVLDEARAIAAERPGACVLICETPEDRARLVARIGRDEFAACIDRRRGDAWRWEDKDAIANMPLWLAALSEMGLRPVVYAHAAETVVAVHARCELHAGAGPAVLVTDMPTDDALRLMRYEFTCYERVLWLRNEPCVILRVESDVHRYVKEDESLWEAITAPHAESTGIKEGLDGAYALLLKHCREEVPQQSSLSAEAVRAYYENTLSWKLTRPMRDVKHWLKRLLRR